MKKNLFWSFCSYFGFVPKSKKIENMTFFNSPEQTRIIAYLSLQNKPVHINSPIAMPDLEAYGTVICTDRTDPEKKLYIVNPLIKEIAERHLRKTNQVDAASTFSN